MVLEWLGRAFRSIRSRISIYQRIFFLNRRSRDAVQGFGFNDVCADYVCCRREYERQRCFENESKTKHWEEESNNRVKEIVRTGTMFYFRDILKLSDIPHCFLCLIGYAFQWYTTIRAVLHYIVAQKRYKLARLRFDFCNDVAVRIYGRAD